MGREKKTKYISKYLNLRLVVKSAYSKMVDGRVVVMPGTAIQFEDGAYETISPKEVKFLEEHANFGSVFVKARGDLAKARAKQFEDLEAREKRIAAREAKLERDKKAMAEGEGVSKVKTRGRKPKKKEKAAF